MQVSYRDEIIEVGGRDEDGEVRVARRYYLVVENARGARAAHSTSLTDEAQAMALRDKVAHHLAAGGVLDPAHWVPIEPAYGSQAYEALDAGGYFWADEVMVAVDAGEPVAHGLAAEAAARLGAVDLPDPLAA